MLLFATYPNITTTHTRARIAITTVAIKLRFSMSLVSLRIVSDFCVGVTVGGMVGIGVGVIVACVVGVGFVVGAGVMEGVVAGIAGADELGEVRKGTKVTVPKLGSSWTS